MKRRAWGAVIGAIGLTMAADCNGNSGTSGSNTGTGGNTSADAPTGDSGYWAGLKDYVKLGGPLNLWLKDLQDAVCQLEEKSTVQLDENRRTCPGGHGGPDVKPPPAYPPR
jgi:hypothetical protein